MGLKIHIISFLLLTSVVCRLEGQVVYEPVTNNGVYELLDELATLKIISINSVVKPYSRVYIAEKLKEADQRTSGPADQKTSGQADKRTSGQMDSSKVVRVSKRLKEEIEFYLRDYRFELGIRNEELGIQSSKFKVQSSKLKAQSSKAQDSGSGFRVPGSGFNYPLSIINYQLSPIPHLPSPIPYPASWILDPGSRAQRALHPASFSYDPISFNIQTKAFRMSLRPAFGARFIVNENGHVWDVTGGGEVFGYLGKHVGYYFNVKQTWQSEALVRPEYFTLEEGKVWRDAGNGSVANTEWRGGISVAWKWGDFGVYKDRPIWGNGVHGTNILSGHAPSFPFIQLHVKPAKWIEFRYIHGWLMSNVVDSARSVWEGNSSKLKYYRKFIAANIITFIPWSGIDLSFGNSVVYSSDNIQAQFLIPFLFYVSVDATVSTSTNFAGNNNQMFFDFSIQKIKYLHLYGSLFIDEINLSKMSDPAKQSNLLGLKAGFELTGFPFRNLGLTFEYSRTNPLVYKHFVPTTSFYNEQYPLGNYLRDNSQEFFVSINFRPVRRLLGTLSCLIINHGTDFPYKPGVNQGFPFLGEVISRMQTFGVNINYQLVNRGIVFLGYEYCKHSADIRYISDIYSGITNNFIFGISIGF